MNDTPQQSQPPAPVPPMDPAGTDFYPPEDVEQGRLLAILGYVITLVWIVPLVQRDNAFALYHAKQAMIINIVGLVFYIVIMGISVITCGFGSILIFAGAALIYPWIMGIINASNGKYEPVPWFGGLVDKYFSGIQADNRK